MRMLKTLTNGPPGESKRDGVDRDLHDRVLFHRIVIVTHMCGMQSFISDTLPVG